MAGEVSSAPEKHRKIVALWRDQLHRAKEAREDWVKIRQRIREQVKGDYSAQFADASGSDADSGTNQDTTAISLVFSTHKTLMPHLVHRNPEIRARSESSPQLAKCTERFSQYQHREQPYKKITRTVIEDADLDGLGCVCTYFDHVRGLPSRRRVRPKNILVNADATSDPRTIRWVAERFVMPIRKAKADTSLKHRHAIKVSHELSGRDSDIETDPDTENYLDADDVHFDQAAGWRICVRDEAPGTAMELEPNEQPPMPDVKIDEVKNRVITLFDHSEWVHQDEAWPFTLDHDEFPYTFVRWNDDDTSFWSLSDYAVNKGTQGFINWMYTFMLRRMRKACTSKILISKQLEDQFEHIRDGIDLKVIPVDDDLLREFERVVKILEFPELKSEYIALLQQAKNHWDEVIGITSYMRGGLPASGSRSATQAEIEDERAQNRIGDKTDRVEDFLAEVARKEMQIAACTIPTYDRYRTKDDILLAVGNLTVVPVMEDTELPEGMELVRFAKGDVFDQSSREGMVLLGFLESVGGMDSVEVLQRGMTYFVGEELGQYWLSLDPVKDAERIRREVHIEVEHGSTRKINRSQEIQDRMQLMNTLVPVYAQTGMYHKVADILNRVVDAFDLGDGDTLKITPEDLQAMGPQAAMALAKTTEFHLRSLQDGTGQESGQMPRLMESSQPQNVNSRSATSSSSGGY